MFLSCIMAFFFSYSSLATEVCQSPQSTYEVIECLNHAHPDIKKTGQDELVVRGIISTSNQFPNPVVEFESTKGYKLGDVVGENRLAVSQLIEIGGKRSARMKLGLAEADFAKAQSVLTKDEVKAQNILQFVRLRQLNEEVAVLEEALKTYEKVHGQYSARPRLAPEQQVAYGIFKLAMGDTRHKLAALQSERKKAETYFKVVSELKYSDVLKYLPQRLKAWPKIKMSQVDNSKNPKFIQIEADLKKSEAAYDLAASESWPDVTVSFIAASNIEGTTEYKTYGFGVALPFPVWNINGGQRKQTFAAKTKAEIEYQEALRRFDLDRQNMLSNYEEFVSALEKSPAAKEIDQKHRATEQLFYQGVISGALVVEAHRQILEYTVTQNELELETLQTLLTLYSQDGKLQEFKYE